MKPLHLRLLALLTVLPLTGCSFLGNTVTDIKVPMPKMPKIPGVGELVGSWPSEDRASDDDPTMPFNSRGNLAYGHTVRLEVYEGTRYTGQIYRSVAMVDEEGILDLGKYGSVKVGGRSLTDARRGVESAFYSSASTAKAITVHFISVENVGLVNVTGDVQADEYVPIFDGMRVNNAITVAGGRKLDSTARSLYLIRSGERRYFTDLATANAEWKLRAGDIVQLSPDL